MPKETVQAIQWALQQTYNAGSPRATDIRPVTASTPHALVDAVREYFNAHAVTYPTFGFADLNPFIA